MQLHASCFPEEKEKVEIVFTPEDPHGYGATLRVGSASIHFKNGEQVQMLKDAILAAAAALQPTVVEADAEGVA